MALTITSSSSEFIELGELKAHANITSTASDLELEMMRAAAEEAVEAIVGPVLHRDVVDRGQAASAGVVVLRRCPVVSVASVLAAGGSAVTYTLNEEAGLLRGVGYGYDADLTVTYVAGRTRCPESLRLAALIIAAHMWDTQKGNTPALNMLDPNASSDFAGSGMAYSIPNRAKDLLRPYMLAPMVA